MIRIKIFDRDYPYIPTMGALIAFKEQTGLEAQEVPPADTALNVKFAYCVVKYACLHCKEEPLALSFEEFCNGLPVDEYYKAIAASMEPDREGGDSPKKQAARSR